MSARAALTTLACAAMLAGCGDADGTPAAPPPAPRVCPTTKTSTSMVLTRFAFVRQDTTRTNVSEGFNLDERVSALGDLASCRQADFTAPDGRTGVDNQLSRLIPLVDAMTGGVLDSALQTAINNGQLLMVVTLDDVQDRCNDPEVNLRFQRVAGMPFVGSDMRVDPGQTFDLMRDAPLTRGRGAIRDGVLTISPQDIPMPVAVLDTRFILMFYGAQLRLRLDDDGGAEGVIGGGISVAEFGATAMTFNIPSALQSTVRTSLQLFADLSPGDDGRCQRISGAMYISARRAFVNP